MNQSVEMFNTGEVRCAVVSDLLTSHGVAEDAWTTTVASIFEVHPQTARRRLASQETFSLEELQRIAAHFNTTVSAMLQASYPSERMMPGARSANLQVGSSSVKCQVVTRPATQRAYGGLVAFEQEGEWRVTDAAEAPPNLPLHIVQNLYLEAAEVPTVVIVDDEAPTTLVRYLNRSAFQAAHFTDTAPILPLLNAPRRPDAYILDWTLANGQTSRPLIEAIRNVDANCPIILLTGTIQSVSTNESEIARVISEYDVELCEKPARFPIIAAKLRVRLGRQPRLTD